jgi:hypothetical protein
MSRDVKYMGMDVHKEAIVIAVRNTSGKAKSLGGCFRRMLCSKQSNWSLGSDNCIGNLRRAKIPFSLFLRCDHGDGRKDGDLYRLR